jgi:hypothetical protein
MLVAPPVIPVRTSRLVVPSLNPEYVQSLVSIPAADRSGDSKPSLESRQTKLTTLKENADC